ncbi:MAG: aminopeptidase [bacterium]|nr:aminopeptidase [bacterium]
MTFHQQLSRYAELLVVHGLNVQKGQIVNISTEACHRDFAVLVAQKAYDLGAKHVDLELLDPRIGRIRIESSTEEDLTYVPPYVTNKYDDLVDTVAANLKIIGSEDPDIFQGLLPRKVNVVRLARYNAVKKFYDDGIGKSGVHWTVAAAATPAWGKKVFPEAKNDKEAEKLLWQAILKACRADKENCLELWREHNKVLQQRGQNLTAMKIRNLHFTGPGTDLHVGLSPRAIFKGGGDLSPRGVEFEPNVPTEEVFTTPDARLTAGTVAATRPFFINGVLIRDLCMTFKDGEIVDYTASAGLETFAEYISSDYGAKRLGEVALVGVDSPIYQSGLVFQEILFDENAACHIAVGSAYKFCINGGATMTAEELANIGCNESSVHTDMMISSEHVNVVAECSDGTKVPLIRNGAWV